MACGGCKKRGEALQRAVAAGAKGEIRDVARELSLVGRSLRDDVRRGALARAAVSRLATLRKR